VIKMTGMSSEKNRKNVGEWVERNRAEYNRKQRERYKQKKEGTYVIKRPPKKDLRLKNLLKTTDWYAREKKEAKKQKKYRVFSDDYFKNKYG